ncbi:MAG TPA: DUF2064 domain-containing protein, partial [Solirubrobacteraceae bacterium]|nr:DUF2064 domain-containing protein [Solirubrobacteraceae bacterium]
MASPGQTAAAEPDAGGPRVLLMAQAPDAEPGRPELAGLLGAERNLRLERLLLERALAWAALVAPGQVHVAYAPAAGEPALRDLAADDVALFPQTGGGASRRLAGAVERLFGERDGPVLVAWPELYRWRPAHADGALDDLHAGCDVSVGLVFDGGFYLLALGRPVPSLFELPDGVWGRPEAMGRLLAAAHHAGLEPGLLRAERGLRRPADVRAALADPLVDCQL